MEAAAKSLQNLGFSPVESAVYIRLCQEGPRTAYAVAKALGKTAPQIYKAIESLVAKGAVEVEEGQSQVCHAVSPDELLASQTRSFTSKIAAAEEALADIRSPVQTSGLTRLENIHTLMARAESMLAEAHRIVLIDAFPTTLDALRPAIESAVKRGLFVAIKSYTAFNMDGARVCVTPKGAAIVDAWPGAWLNLVTDGEKLLVALVEQSLSQVSDAFYTENPMFALLHHNGLAHELCLDLVRPMLTNAAKEVLQDWDALYTTELPSIATLSQRVEGGGDDPA